MILLLALAAAVTLAYLCGGRLSKLATLPLRGAGLVLAAFSIQVAIVYLTPLTIYRFESAYAGSMGFRHRVARKCGSHPRQRRAHAHDL